VPFSFSGSDNRKHECAGDFEEECSEKEGCSETATGDPITREAELFDGCRKEEMLMVFEKGRISGLVCERARVADFLAIAALDRVAWGQSRHADRIPDGEHVWRIWVEHALVFCARNEKGTVVGTVLAFPCLSGVYCVHKAFVDEKFRNQGIGTGLFKLLLEEIDRLQADCFLTVDPSNESALRLYHKWGFEERQLMKGFYREDEDRYVLTRRSKKASAW
jgi:GNAT superfamily N-acetyltransferase